jgi:hypothetical protein
MRRLALALMVSILAPPIEAPAQDSNVKAEIAELINAWAFFRDQESWDALLGTFHEGGTISISWFDGPHAGFVAASKRLAANRTSIVKHHIGVPMISVNGDRALSEVNVTIMVRAKTDAGEVDTTSFARFYDRLERRDGKWKLLKRTAIYEKDRADPVSQPALPAAFFEGLDQYPAEVRFLASSLKRVGAQLSKTIVFDKTPESSALYQQGTAWLAGR